MRTLAILSLLLVGPVGRPCAATGQIVIPAKEKFHLYLLLGQSNMAGRGPLPAEPPAPHPRILVLNQSNDWTVAVDPLHFDDPSAGVGPGLSFAEAMLAAEKDPAVVIGLIPCAEGGTPLARWQTEGDLFQNAVRRARIAASTGTLKGVVWHQGENDALSVAKAESYGHRLARMIQDLRTALGGGELPVVVGTLCDAIEGHGSYPGAEAVNRALANLPQQVSRTACADANGLPNKGDGVHFTTAAQVEFGRRYAAQMLKLTQPN
jgi:hypothetical protein